MGFNDIGDAILLIFDTLRNDEESQYLIEEMDCADDDASLKSCIHRAVNRLDTVNPSVAKVIRDKTKGYMSFK